MNTHETQSSTPLHNLGFIGRIVRFFVGGVMYTVGWYMLVSWGYVVFGLVVSLVSAYPIMTALLGWDPLYQMSRYSNSQQTTNGRVTK